MVDPAALHTACSRHQAAHRKAEAAVAEPAATAPGRAKTELRNRSTNRPVGAYCGGDLSLASTDSKALNRLRSAQLRKFGSYQRMQKHSRHSGGERGLSTKRELKGMTEVVENKPAERPET